MNRRTCAVGGALLIALAAGYFAGRVTGLNGAMVIRGTEERLTSDVFLPTGVPAAAPHADARVNINTASAAELSELPGIGPALSERIIDYRTTNGRFESIEEIKAVKGIGDKLFASIEPLITVE